MKGDFTRDTFDITKHFSRVLQQQGRVQLDADWNEQTAILLHYLRTLAADLIGPFAGPAGDAQGFKISISNNGDGNDLDIGMGRYYVDGILCENDEDELTYETQTDYPNPPALVTNKRYLVYLDVWERHITALEDDYIREKALGELDTATRAKVVWQVKVEDTAPNSLYFNNLVKQPENWFQWIERWQSKHRGCLRVRVKQPDKSTDPCLTAPDAKYRGPENQLYRIEIHTGGTAGTATFKWSRDNGAIVTGCTLSGTELTVDNPRGFTEKGWVELTNDGLELRGQPGTQPGTLVKVLKLEGDVMSLEKAPDEPLGLSAEEIGKVWATKVRRWDHSSRWDHSKRNNPDFDENTGMITVRELSSVELANDDAEWIKLEHGIEIQFLPASGDEPHQYRSGDYWLIPARVATGDIEWPLELEEDGITPVLTDKGRTNPLPQPPHGIHHHYAPLAILDTNTSAVSSSPPTDLRCEFHPLHISCNLSYSYGEMGIGGHLLCDSGDS